MPKDKCFSSSLADQGLDILYLALDCVWRGISAVASLPHIPYLR